VCILHVCFYLFFDLQLSIPIIHHPVANKNIYTELRHVMMAKEIITCMCLRGVILSRSGRILFRSSAYRRLRASDKGIDGRGRGMLWRR
jgi:hypothetical protein